MFNWIKENIAVLASISMVLLPFFLIIINIVLNKIEDYFYRRKYGDNKKK